MRHTVIAFFDTYAQAEQARDMLTTAGLASGSIALQARGEPTYATDATLVTQAEPADDGLLASIERFFESLFAAQPPQHETAQYAETVRRGAVMLSVDVATDEHCELAKATLERANPIDIEARAATWCAPGDDAQQRGAVRSYVRETKAQPSFTPDEYLQEEEDAPGKNRADGDRS